MHSTSILKAFRRLLRKFVLMADTQYIEQFAYFLSKDPKWRVCMCSWKQFRWFFFTKLKGELLGAASRIGFSLDLLFWPKMNTFGIRNRLLCLFYLFIVSNYLHTTKYKYERKINKREQKKTISYKRIMLRHHLNAAQKMNKQFVFKLNCWKFNSILSVFYWEIFVFSAFVCSSLLILCILHTLTHIMFALNLISYYPFNGGRDVRFVKVCKQSKMI